MAEDVAEPETRPAELERNEKPDLTLQRKSDDLSQQKDGESADRKQREADKLPASLPRWPFLLVGLVVAIFVAVVLYIIFRPRPDVRTADAYVMVHYATIAPRISGQIATVPVDDNDVVQTGRVLATLDPRDNETALASAEAAVARQVEIG
jgi:membrane fusion protein, multidrug efflux system